MLFLFEVLQNKFEHQIKADRFRRLLFPKAYFEYNRQL